MNAAAEVAGRGAVTVGIDIGTTGAKAVVWDPERAVLASAGAEYPTTYVGAGGAEQDPADWWTAAGRCVRAALERAGVDPKRVAAVGVSSQAPSVVALDGAGEPVRPAVLWLDRRGAAECDRRAAAAPAVLARTGNRLDPCYAAPKLAWLRAAEPEAASRTRTVLTASGYLVHRLTGVAAVDSGHVGLSLLGELSGRRWLPDLVELWGIPAGWLPPVHDPSTVVGRVLPEAAGWTGLAAGTPVVAGAVDGATASLDAGLVRAGDVGEMTGQSTVVNAPVPSERLRTDRLGALAVMPYPVPDHHLLFGAMVATGGILRWFRDQLGHAEVAAAGSAEAAYAALDALAGTAPAGSGGLVLLPYFLGERSPIWDVQARGAVVGLSLATTRAELVRAVYEGTAYGLAHNLEELARLGLEPSVLRVVGGGARGRVWNQIKADVTGLPVAPAPTGHGAPAGAALLAAYGVGLVADLAAAARDRHASPPAEPGAGGDPGRLLRPDPERHARYRGYRQVYRDLYPALRPAYAALAALCSRPAPD